MPESIESSRRRAFLTIYKSFIRPNLDYGDFIYEQPNSDPFYSKIESSQYNAVLAINGAVQRTSQTKIFNELGLESIRLRQSFISLCARYKISTTGLPSYLNIVLQKAMDHYQTQNWVDLATYQTRINLTCLVFRNHLVKIIPPVFNPGFNIENYIFSQVHTRLRLGLSHLIDLIIIFTVVSIHYVLVVYKGT